MEIKKLLKIYIKIMFYLLVASEASIHPRKQYTKPDEVISAVDLLAL